MATAIATPPTTPPPASEPDPEFLTAHEVARRARVSYETIRGMITRGELQAVRVGKLYRVPVAAVEQLLTPTRAPAAVAQPAATGQPPAVADAAPLPSEVA